ncbi:hypothetical protein [Paraburkholderia rhynchosiae]|uniref:Uncharacterized protein n=1 Tax=Paraburkholderia rhynchosiae TaxID=487049 RepID=A0A2N7WTZ1_9BURK|nr:hypothetical protein [Paraburkholderia rhynchosiae]PMS32870.1 hypothetical protein C0Z16_04800 [Paraburkholderia rhynchosiae]CAB3645484.1 hypothetical protein LMG27174_00818 [Paraburkholderia rhynchosiae]
MKKTIVTLALSVLATAAHADGDAANFFGNGGTCADMQAALDTPATGLMATEKLLGFFDGWALASGSGRDMRSLPLSNGGVIEEIRYACRQTPTEHWRLVEAIYLHDHTHAKGDAK